MHTGLPCIFAYFDDKPWILCIGSFGQEIEAVPVDVLPKELFEKSGISSMQATELDLTSKQLRPRWDGGSPYRQEIFAILDVDGGGELSQDEFVVALTFRKRSVSGCKLFCDQGPKTGHF